ncbi:MAG TPA: PAS domain S-box protein [Nitrospiria bacterium]|nr:PAS domain S-box protein [Nitrospiria bacterium]
MSVMRALPYAAMIVSPTGRIVFSSDQTEKVFGYSREDLLGKSIEVLVPERFRGIHGQHRAQYDSHPMIRPMMTGLELFGHRKDGTDIPVEISLSPFNLSGRTFVIALVQDITDRTLTVDALRSAKAEAENLVQTANVMVIGLDANGCVNRMNKAAEKITGYTQTELVGKNWFETLVPKDKYPHVWEEFNRLISGGVPKTFENPILTKSGEERFILWQNNEVKADGRIVGTVSYGNDVTERKRMEEALRESERRFRNLSIDQERQLILSDRLISFGEMTASLAHEFNNPLGIVIGFAQDLLTEVDPSDPRYQSVRIIEEEARRCKKIMQDLLDFGRQEAPQHSQIDPMELVRKSLELISHRLFKAGIRSVIEDSAGLPKIWADPHQLGQVLVNLFFNAIEAMPNGGTLTVGIAARPPSIADRSVNDPDSNDDVIITVADTGRGIEPNNLSKVFLPFFTTRNKKGMGLGLSICKSIIEAHNGKISVESLPGRGTTFFLYLRADPRRHTR